MEVRERAGLLVVGSTLRSDWDSNGILADVRGAVWIEVTHRCHLQPDLIEEIGELLAIEAAHETLEQRVSVTGWKVQRTGNRLEVTAQEYSDSEARQGRPSPYFNEHAASVRPVNGWGS